MLIPVLKKFRPHFFLILILMDFLKLRKDYGVNFFYQKEIIFSFEKKTEKIILYLLLNFLICQSFEKNRNFLKCFRFFFCSMALNYGEFFFKNSKKFQKINIFFRRIELSWIKNSFFFLKAFFKEITYEIEFLLFILKKGIFEGWVSFPTIKFYFYPFFKLIEIFFIIITRIIKKKIFEKQILFEFFKFKTSKLCSSIKKAYYYFFWGIFFRYFQLKHRYLSFQKLRGGYMTSIGFSFFSPQTYLAGGGGVFKNKFENTSKFFFLSKQLIQNFPEWKRIFMIRKFGKFNFSNIWKKKKKFFLFSKNFFLGTSCLALKIVKKLIKIPILFTNFSRFLFYFWNQVFLDTSYRLSDSIFSFLEIIKEEKFKAKKNFFGFFLLQFFPQNFFRANVFNVSRIKLKATKTFLPVINIPSNSVKIICFLKWPISVLITRNSMDKYQILLRFFFRLKTEECVLLLIWRDQMANRIEESENKLFPTLNLVQQIFSFFRTLNYHYIHHVFENNLQELERKVTFCPELHQVIFHHEKFISLCLDQFSISSPISYKILLRIISTSSLFCFFIRKKEKKVDFFLDKTKKGHLFETSKKKRLNPRKIFRGAQFFKTNFEKNVKKFLAFIKKTPNLNSSYQNFEKMLNFNRYYI